MKRNLWRCLQALAALALCLPCLPGAAMQFPPDSGVLNVRDFGARGDGRHDDTAAIRAALLAAQVDQGRGFWPAKIVYFPSGTYRVTDTISKRAADGRYLNSLNLHGASRDHVRIRLDDAAPGFDQPQQPKAVIFTASALLGGQATAGGKDYRNKGEGNEAYGNYIEDITIDVGKGNPGAVAIDYIANNAGAIRRVRLVAPAGSGQTGLAMERKWPGPLLVTSLVVEGFARGISVRWREYSVTLENLRMRGQTEVGIRNEGNSLALNDVYIEGAPQAIQNLSPEGLIVADDMEIKPPAGSPDWIDNRGYFTFRNVVLTGPSRGIARARGGLTGAQWGAYFGSARLPGFDASWGLAIEQAPVAWQPPAGNWANVMRFGAIADSGEDAAPGIRAAMASGAEVIYFPSGRYTLSDSIEVPAHVRRIAGMYSAFTIERRVPAFLRTTGVFRVETDGEPLTLERMAIDNTGRGSQLGLSHTGPRTLVLRDFTTVGVGAVDRPATGGRLFLENTGGGNLQIAGEQGVWSRQFNTEGQHVRIGNKGSPLWILGIKSEQNSTLVEGAAGSRTEVLGGLLYIVHTPKERRPAFLSRPGATLTAAYAESAYVAEAVYKEHMVQEYADGSRHVVTADQLPARGLARILPGLTLPPVLVVAEGKAPVKESAP